MDLILLRVQSPVFFGSFSISEGIRLHLHTLQVSRYATKDQVDRVLERPRGDFLVAPPAQARFLFGPAKESGREDMPTMPTMPADAHWKSARERSRFFKGGGFAWHAGGQARRGGPPCTWQLLGVY